MDTNYRKDRLQIQKIFELENKEIVLIERVDKGLTNNNYNVKTLSGTFHMRLNQANILGINRQHENIVLERIKSLNIAPNTIANNVDENYLITAHIDLPTWSKQNCYDFQPLLIETIQRIHAIDDFSDKLPSFATRLKQYENKSLHKFAKSFQIEYLKTRDRLKELMFFEANQLLHFDLNASNLIGTKKLTIIDWEFAGYGHPIFDMAIFIHYNQLEISQCKTVVNYCHIFENGKELLQQSLKLAEFMIKLWEAKE